MKQKVNYLLVTGFVVIFAATASCRKDPPVGCSSASDTIYFGEACGMVITSHDESYTVGTSSGTYDYIDVDVNHDQFMDLRIFTSVSGSYFYGYRPWTGVDCLHDSVFVSGNLLVDTLYYYETVEYYGSNPVLTTVSHYKSCYALTDSDTVFAIDDEMQVHGAGEELNRSDNWLGGHGHFRWKPDYTIPGVYGPPVNDTVTVHDQVFTNSCRNAPFAIPVYIGFKAGTGANEKLGWLKLTCSGASVTLHETAIQE